jgi:hypothetical protein
MSVGTLLFEVGVLVKGKEQYKYTTEYYGKGDITNNSFEKMFHIEARTAKQACLKARKYGTPKTCRKVDALSLLSNIENIDLKQKLVFGINSPFKNAIAMDEMIWNKKKSKKKKFDKKTLDI